MFAAPARHDAAGVTLADGATTAGLLAPATTGVPARILLVALCSGVVAASSGAAPTGRPVVDATITGGGVAVVTATASHTSWWAVALAAIGAAVGARNPALAIVAGSAVIIVLVAGRGRFVLEPRRCAAFAVAGGLTLNVLMRSRLDAFLGQSAILGFVAAAVIVTSALCRTTNQARRWALRALGLVVVTAGAAVGTLAYAAVTARHDLSAGASTAERGIAALEDGDFDAAEQLFREAADHLDRGHRQMSGPLGWMATVVPVASQHRDAITSLTGAGATSAFTVADALGDLDLDALQIIGGRIDLAELIAVEQPLQRVRDALSDLQSVTSDSRSPWLVAGATDELDDLDHRVSERLPSLDDALLGLRLAPDLLGGSGPRRYLVLFTNPSESRGLGGFIGSYAELTADHGAIALGAIGQARDLDERVLAAGGRVPGHEDFLRQYGRFGFDHDGAGAVGDAAFRNLAMTPHFPWVGEIAADLYEQTTGRAIDGVIAVDPYVLATLLSYTGPIELPEYDQQLSADNAVSYLLRDQYIVGDGDHDQRHDSLGEAARIAFDASMAGGLPDPLTIAHDFGPLAADRRLFVWSADGREQELIEQVGLAGGIPPLDGADGWAFTVSNGAANKIDSYLERRARYVASTDASGDTTATLEITLTNTAPAEGLPRYIIGGPTGLPAGTSRLYVSVYSALGLDEFLVDGTRVAVHAGDEMGWNVFSRFVDIPPGGSVTVEVHLARMIDRPGEVVTWEQPLASDLMIVE